MLREFEIIPGRWIGGDHPCYIIAEIGQNHQGDINIAKEMILAAKDCGVDCVKFQKSHLESRFNKDALCRPYISPHSWGNTYGEHRKHLEFNSDQFRELYNFSQQHDITFAASGMDKKSVEFLQRLGVEFFKVGSGDGNNFPLLKYIAEFEKPMIISTGMQDMKTIKRVYELLIPLNDKLCFLLCTSSYPAPFSDIHLNALQTYRKELPEAVIGYSGHETGIEVSIAAVALGAKLGKTVVASQFIPSGTVLSEEMLDIKVAEPKGWQAENMYKLIGRTTKQDIEFDSSITEEIII